MKSMQDRLLEHIERLAAKRDLETACTTEKIKRAFFIVFHHKGTVKPAGVMHIVIQDTYLRVFYLPSCGSQSKAYADDDFDDWLEARVEQALE